MAVSQPDWQAEEYQYADMASQATRGLAYVGEAAAVDSVRGEGLTAELAAPSGGSRAVRVDEEQCQHSIDEAEVRGLTPVPYD